MKRALLAAFVLTAAVPELFAAESAAHMAVSVVVLPHASIAQVGGDAVVTVGPEDVQRGVIALEATYELRCNTRRGVALWFSPRQGLAHSIDIRLDQAVARLADQAVVLMHADPAPRSTIVVNYDLRLAPGTPPGRYPLPVQVAAEPL